MINIKKVKEKNIALAVKAIWSLWHQSHIHYSLSLFCHLMSVQILKLLICSLTRYGVGRYTVCCWSACKVQTGLAAILSWSCVPTAHTHTHTIFLQFDRHFLSWFYKLSAAESTETTDDNANLERLERVCRMTEIEDLQGPHRLPYAPLCIKVIIDTWSHSSFDPHKCLWKQ